VNNAICIIPARGLADGLPKKNFKPIDGTPLLAHTINSGLESAYVSDVVVSTESDELAAIAADHGATVPFRRPVELSQEDALVDEVVHHAVTELSEMDQYDIGEKTPIVVLQPNVPFTRPQDIDNAIETYKDNRDRAVISVTEERDFFWKQSTDGLSPIFKQRGVRAELEPLYRETGSIYVTNRQLLSGGDRVGDAPLSIVTDKISAFEVETLIDFWLAERITQGPKIAFRVDGGDDIGMGHVYSCLTLVMELENVLNSNITFVTDEQYQGGLEKLQSVGFDVVTINGQRQIDLLNSLEPDAVFVDILDTSDQYIKSLYELPAAIINLEDLVPAYKIASADLTNHPLIRHIARKEKPILLSTGASTVGEIDDAVRVIEDEITDPRIYLLHCILQYPTDVENANLGMISHLNDLYPEYSVGYSDHVPPDEGMITLLNAEFQGADIIEKHFTLNKELEGNDHYHAMDPSDVRTFKENQNIVSNTTGSSRKQSIAAEADSRTNARRSLVAAKDVKPGTKLTRDHLAIKRPGTGISPTAIDRVTGKKVSQAINEDEIITWEHI
jgi:sialic acid synthase SpsE/CMP-N-acetylneuraminic acid synthetase